MADLIFKDEVYRIVGAAMEVYNEMGHGFLEPIYQESLAIEMKLRPIPYVEMPSVQVVYKDHVLKKTYEPDYIAYDAIIVEIKALEHLTNREESQIINYLNATGHPVGLLINFGSSGGLEWKRFVNTRGARYKQEMPANHANPP